MRRGTRSACLLISAAGAAMAADPVPRAGVIASVDVGKRVAARSPWRLTVTRGAPEKDDLFDSDDMLPGEVSLCLSRDGGRTCVPALQHLLAVPSYPEDTPHYLNVARVVLASPGRPLLLVQVASRHAVNGSQGVGTALLELDKPSNRWRVVYRHLHGTNNNAEVRFVERGALRGDVVVAEPTANAPFGYWITVNRLAAGGYRQVLRYRSATRYSDGNTLAVIDSELPAMERRLGLWRPDQPLPLPPGPCARPHLVRMELWCGPAVPYR